MSTPSDRSQDQLFTDRRGSDTPDDYINSEGGAILYGTDYKLNDYITFKGYVGISIVVFVLLLLLKKNYKNKLNLKL